MKLLWLEFRMYLVELLIKLQLWLIPSDHRHAKKFLECTSEYLQWLNLQLNKEIEDAINDKNNRLM